MIASLIWLIKLVKQPRIKESTIKTKQITSGCTLIQYSPGPKAHPTATEVEVLKVIAPAVKRAHTTWQWGSQPSSTQSTRLSLNLCKLMLFLKAQTTNEVHLEKDQGSNRTIAARNTRCLPKRSQVRTARAANSSQSSLTKKRDVLWWQVKSTVRLIWVQFTKILRKASQHKSCSTHP